MTLSKRNVDAIGRREKHLPNGKILSLPIYPNHTVTIGQRVRSLRESRGLLVSDAARLAQITPTELDKIEHGAAELLDPPAALAILDAAWKPRR